MSDHPEHKRIDPAEFWDPERMRKREIAREAMQLRQAFERTALAAVLYGTASIDASGLSAVQAFVVRDIVAQYYVRKFRARALRWFRQQRKQEER